MISLESVVLYITEQRFGSGLPVALIGVPHLHGHVTVLCFLMVVLFAAVLSVWHMQGGLAGDMSFFGG